MSDNHKLELNEDLVNDIANNINNNMNRRNMKEKKVNNTRKYIGIVKSKINNAVLNGNIGTKLKEDCLRILNLNKHNLNRYMFASESQVNEYVLVSSTKNLEILVKRLNLVSHIDRCFKKYNGGGF